jgi:hypothetical protein
MVMWYICDICAILPGLRTNDFFFHFVMSVAFVYGGVMRTV